MTPLLSIIIAAHNEKLYQIIQTIDSIRATAGQWVEIIIVDDCTIVPICCLPVKIIRNKYRMGVGPSRHIGVEAATADNILITDAHMIFTDGWLKPMLDLLSCGPKLVLCGQCVAIHEHAVNLNHPLGTYNGARMVLHDPEENIRWRVLTAKWANDKRGKDFYPLSAMMGACYAMRKQFFLDIGGLRILKEFGGDEELLSIKTILAGGEIRMFKSLRVGHKFRDKGSQVPYRITVERCLYNTIVTALTCMPTDEAKKLIAKIGPGRELYDAQEMVRKDMSPIEAERARVQPAFTRSWDEYLKIIAQIDETDRI